MQTVSSESMGRAGLQVSSGAGQGRTRAGLLGFMAATAANEAIGPVACGECRSGPSITLAFGGELKLDARFRVGSPCTGGFSGLLPLHPNPIVHENLIARLRFGSRRLGEETRRGDSER